MGHLWLEEDGKLEADLDSSEMWSQTNRKIKQICFHIRTCVAPCEWFTDGVALPFKGYLAVCRGILDSDNLAGRGICIYHNH